MLTSVWPGKAQEPKAAPVKGRILPLPCQITRAYQSELSLKSAFHPLPSANFHPTPWKISPRRRGAESRVGFRLAGTLRVRHAARGVCRLLWPRGCWVAFARSSGSTGIPLSPTLHGTHTMATSPHTPRPTEHLERVLGPWMATALVVGTVIGSGVFKKPTQVAQFVPTFGWAIAAWVLLGLLVLCGGLALTEVIILYPRAGGNYVFLREGYGR